MIDLKKNTLDKGNVKRKGEQKYCHFYEQYGWINKRYVRVCDGWVGSWERIQKKHLGTDHPHGCVTCPQCLYVSYEQGMYDEAAAREDGRCPHSCTTCPECAKK